MQREIQFLCGLLGKAKDERDANMKEIASLGQLLKNSNDIIEKVFSYMFFTMYFIRVLSIFGYFLNFSIS